MPNEIIERQAFYLPAYQHQLLQLIVAKVQRLFELVLPYSLHAPYVTK